MHYLTVVALAATLTGLGLLRLYALFKQINHSKKVPGPTLTPYLGRIHDLPIKFMWHKLHEWGLRCEYLLKMMGQIQMSFLVVFFIITGARPFF